MRVLVVDHNALEPANRVLYDALVGLGEMNLRLIVPSRWFNNFRLLTFSSPVEQPAYELCASEVYFPTRTHRLIYRSLSRHLREFRPDILYMNAEPENFQTFQAAKLLSLHQTHLVFSSWRTIDHVRTGYPYKLGMIHRQMEKTVLKKAAHGIVFNPTAKKIFALRGYDATTIIPPPIDTRVFFPKRDIREDLPFVVGYVGRLVEAKGIDLLLEALAPMGSQFHAIIVGDGAATGRLQQVARTLQLGDRVKFRPAASPEELPDILSLMDVVVLPSRTTKTWTEQFGRILVEAMACGIPVLGSSSGEIPNVIGDAGLVFKEGSVDGLRLGLERLAKSTSLQEEMRERGLRRVNEKFECRHIARQMHALFRRIYETSFIESGSPNP